MKKLKSPVYLCFLVGGGCFFLGFGVTVIGWSLYGPKHWLLVAGAIIGTAGFVIYCVPMFAALVFLSAQRLRNWWRRGQ